MSTDLLGTVEIGKQFLAKAGYGFARLENARFDDEAKQWILDFDVAIMERRLKRITIDAKTGKVLSLVEPGAIPF